MVRAPAADRDRAEPALETLVRAASRTRAASVARRHKVEALVRRGRLEDRTMEVPQAAEPVGPVARAWPAVEAGSRKGFAWSRTSTSLGSSNALTSQERRSQASTMPPGTTWAFRTRSAC